MSTDVGEEREGHGTARSEGPACRVPCKSCPWRVDQTAEDIPHFSLELAERLDRTSKPDATIGDPMFACHQSRVGEEFPCAGWLAVHGHRHPAARLAVFQGRITAQALNVDPAGPELHESFEEVIEKLRRTARPDQR